MLSYILKSGAKVQLCSRLSNETLAPCSERTSADDWKTTKGSAASELSVATTASRENNNLFMLDRIFTAAKVIKICRASF